MTTEEARTSPELEPRISCVIPCYNRENIVGRAIESALAQTRPPQEIVVVDDGSTDATRTVIQSFGDSVVGVFGENGGASVARNRGVERATGDWIAFLDSDDYWVPTHLERIVAAIRGTDGRARVYFSDMQRPPEEEGRLLWELCDFTTSGAYEVVDDATDWAMLRRQPMMLQSSVVRSSAYDAAGGLRAELPSRHDTHLFFRLCIGGAACAVAGCGTRMTSDGGTGRVTSVYSGRTDRYWSETVFLYRDILRRHPALPREHRRELRERLAAAHLRLARLAWQNRCGLEAVARVGQAAWTHPGRLLRGLGLRAPGRPRP